MKNDCCLPIHNSDCVVYPALSSKKQVELLGWQAYFCAQRFEDAYLHARGGYCVVCGEVKPICCGDITECEDGSLAYHEARCRDCCGPHYGRNLYSGVGYYTRMDCDH